MTDESAVTVTFDELPPINEPKVLYLAMVAQDNGQAFLCYDNSSLTQPYRAFTKEGYGDLIELVNAADLIVCYGMKPVLLTIFASYIQSDLALRIYDVQQELWIASGLPSDFHPDTHQGFSFDNAVFSNLGFRRPKFPLRSVGAFFDMGLYFLHNTKRLYEAALEGMMTCPKTGANVLMRYPFLPPTPSFGAPESTEPTAAEPNDCNLAPPLLP